MTKFYAKETVAASIAAKLTKKDGEERQVVAHEGKFAVMTAAQLEAFQAELAAIPDFTDAPAEEQETSNEASNEAPAEASGETSEAPKVVGGQLIAMDVVGAWSSKGYIYTPVMSGVKRKAKTRWFPAAKVQVEPIEGGLRLIAPAKVFTSRDIDIATAKIVTEVAPEAEPTVYEQAADLLEEPTTDNGDSGDAMEAEALAS